MFRDLVALIVARSGILQSLLRKLGLSAYQYGQDSDSWAYWRHTGTRGNPGEYRCARPGLWGNGPGSHAANWQLLPVASVMYPSARR